MGLTMSQRKAVTKATATRYWSASKGAKAVILDELCATTGWHRDHARKALRQVLGPKRDQGPPAAAADLRRTGAGRGAEGVGGDGRPDRKADGAVHG